MQQTFLLVLVGRVSKDCEPVGNKNRPNTIKLVSTECRSRDFSSENGRFSGESLADWGGLVLFACLLFVRDDYFGTKKTTTLFCFAICISLHFSSVQRDNKYGVCVCIFLLLILHFATTITMSFFDSPCGI